jgi:hypothetical protein
MLEMKNSVKGLNSSQGALNRALEPLLEECEQGQGRLRDGTIGQCNALMESCMGMIKSVEATMFDYAHEKARNAMLLDLVHHGAPDAFIEDARKQLRGGQ